MPIKMYKKNNIVLLDISEKTADTLCEQYPTIFKLHEDELLRRAGNIDLKIEDVPDEVIINKKTRKKNATT